MRINLSRIDKEVYKQVDMKIMKLLLTEESPWMTSSLEL